MIFMILIGLLPSFFQVPLRRLLGARIGEKVRIRAFTFLYAKDVDIGDCTSIGPFSIIRSRKIFIGKHSKIKPLSVLSCGEIKLGNYTHIAPTAIILGNMRPRSKFSLGDHSRIFPFCWFEPGEGIEIGKDVGIGGHGLIFTHGSWTDYLRGGPVQFGPVKIEDGVWLPWRVTVLPNVTIGKYAVIGANSMVNRSVPPRSLSAGMPAKVLKENLVEELSSNAKINRASEILEAYRDLLLEKNKNTEVKLYNQRQTLRFDYTISLNINEKLKEGDILINLDSCLSEACLLGLLTSGVNVIDHDKQIFHLAGTTSLNYVEEFIVFLRRFGVRLYIETYKMQ